MKNYYEILEVNPRASEEVIKKAHQVLIKKYHPDLYVGVEREKAEEKIRNINEAYKILSDGFLREQYDAELNKQIVEEQIENYNRLYRNSGRKDAFEEKEYEQEQEEKPKSGTLMAMVDILKQIFINRPKRPKKEKLEKEDITAGIITAVIVIVLGIILWLIPATRGFVRDIIPF